MACTMLQVNVFAQQETSGFVIPTTNSKSEVQQTVAATTIEITYSRPSVRGRAIFGALVPFGQVWRTGSDAATRISFSTPVRLNGSPVDSGSYELFTIPGADTWTIILQQSHGQWGSYSYDASNDLARFPATPVNLPDPVETFTISIDNVKSHSAVLNIAWDHTRVPVEIAIDLEATVVPQLEAVLRSEGRRPYFLAAMFYFENDLNIDRAAELMALAIEQNPKHIGMLYRQALILERKGDIPGARAAAEHSLAGATSANAELRAEYTHLNTALLARLKQD